MSLRSLWILCLVSLFLVMQQFLSLLPSLAFTLGLIGLAITAMLAFIGWRKKDSRPHYQAILFWSIIPLVVWLAVLWLFWDMRLSPHGIN